MFVKVGLVKLGPPDTVPAICPVAPAGSVVAGGGGPSVINAEQLSECEAGSIDRRERPALAARVGESIGHTTHDVESDGGGLVVFANADHLGSTIRAGEIEAREIRGHRQEGEGEAIENRGVAVADDRVGVVDSQRLGKGRIQRVDDVGKSLSMGGTGGEQQRRAQQGPKEEILGAIKRIHVDLPIVT
jgi:hypothetical protein